MPNIDLSILNQRQTPAFYADVFANRPAAGFVGRIFVSTNTFAFYRDNGTGWDLIGGPGTGTITGSGTANTFTIFTGASTIGDSSYLTQAANVINVANADLILPANNTVGGTNYGLRQQMATNDFWTIYGNSAGLNQGELVFQVGDDNLPYPTSGNRFRFSNSNMPFGTSTKDLFIIDLNDSNLNTNLLISSGNNLGIGVAVPSGLIHADGGASAARMIIDADNGIARIFSFRTDNLPRWALRVDGTETGSNVGGDFSIRRYDDTGAFVDAPLTVTRSTGQSTFAKKVVIENNAGDQQLQIVSTTAPSLRIDNLQTGATKRAGLGISTATNNFIQGSADRDFCIFNGSTAAASPILFGIYDAAAVNVQEAARISAARNFLIGGTSDNGSKLRIFGSIYTEGTTSSSYIATFNQQNVTNGDSFGIIVRGGTNSSDAAFRVQNAAATTQFLSIQGNGNIGVGTITPSRLFSIFGGANTSRIILQNTATGQAINNGLDITMDGTDAQVWNYQSGSLQFGTSNAERGRFSSSGNLLIGTTTDAGQKLQVAGNIRATGNFVYNTYGNLQTATGTAFNNTITVTINTTNIIGNIQINASAYGVATGNQSTAMWFCGGEGSNSMIATEITRNNPGAFLTISAITSAANSLVFTLTYAFGNAAYLSVNVLTNDNNANIPTITIV